MGVYQVYNKKTKAYVKIRSYKGKKLDKIMNVKQKNPNEPFKGVMIKNKR